MVDDETELIPEDWGEVIFKPMLHLRVLRRGDDPNDFSQWGYNITTLGRKVLAYLNEIELQTPQLSEEV